MDRPSEIPDDHRPGLRRAVWWCEDYVRSVRATTGPPVRVVVVVVAAARTDIAPEA